MDKIEYIGTEPNEDGIELHQYNYKFSTGTIKLGEDDGEKYMGISMYNSIVAMAADTFRWDIIKFAFKYDLNKPEDFHEFIKKFNPEHEGTLEELIENWDNDINQK